VVNARRSGLRDESPSTWPGTRPWSLRFLVPCARPEIALHPGTVWVRVPVFHSQLCCKAVYFSGFLSAPSPFSPPPVYAEIGVPASQSVHRDVIPQTLLLHISLSGGGFTSSMEMSLARCRHLKLPIVVRHGPGPEKHRSGRYLTDAKGQGPFSVI
jgi:hypothetical protein